MTKDIRKEQLTLLRFEKQITGLAVSLAVCATAAKAADGKLHASEGTAAYADIQAALMNLAEVTGNAHEVLNAKALEMGAQMFQASGGLPKSDPPAVVASILGIG